LRVQIPEVPEVKTRHALPAAERCGLVIQRSACCERTQGTDDDILHLASPLKSRSSRFKGNGAEGERWCPLDHELQINPVIRKLQEIDFLKLPLEFTDEVRGIFSANSERNDRACVSQHRVAHVRLKLVQILMGYGEANGAPDERPFLAGCPRKARLVTRPVGWRVIRTRSRVKLILVHAVETALHFRSSSMNNSQSKPMEIAAPSFEHIVEAYNLSILTGPGDWSLEGGDLALTKDGDPITGDLAYNGLFRFVQTWRYNTAHLHYLFDTMTEMIAWRTSLDEKANAIGKTSSEKFLDFAEPLGVILEEQRVATFGATTYSGCLILVPQWCATSPEG
jgi:hypothetical protein